MLPEYFTAQEQTDMEMKQLRAKYARAQGTEKTVPIRSSPNRDNALSHIRR
jgi:hypothetical protein